MKNAILPNGGAQSTASPLFPTSPFSSFSTNVMRPFQASSLLAPSTPGLPSEIILEIMPALLVIVSEVPTGAMPKKTCDHE